MPSVSSLMWELGRAKSFDVVAGSTQATPSQYILPCLWGVHCCVGTEVSVTAYDQGLVQIHGIVAILLVLPVLQAQNIRHILVLVF